MTRRTAAAMAILLATVLGAAITLGPQPAAGLLAVLTIAGAIAAGWPSALRAAAPAAAVVAVVALAAAFASPRTPGALPLLGGGSFALADHAGRPVVLNLWATWCAPCRRELPMMAEAAAAHPGVTFAFAAQREEAQRVATFLAVERIALPNVVLDEGGAWGRAHGTLGLPTTLFFRPDGSLAAVHVGEIDAPTLAARIAELRADQRAQ